MHEFKYSELVNSDDVETELLEQLVVDDIIIISTCMPRSLKGVREKTSNLRDISSVFFKYVHYQSSHEERLVSSGIRWTTYYRLWLH